MPLALPQQVVLMDVSPRDGLQAEPVFVPTEKKVALIASLIDAGLKRIELTSFVSPKWVPQMADAEAVLQAIVPLYPDVTFEVLLPNEKGYDRSLATGLVKQVGYIVAATESLNTKNVNMSVAASLNQFGAITRRAKADGVRTRGTIGVSFVCPYEGEVDAEKVISIADTMIAAGADEICIADTIGRAVPNRVYDLFTRLRERHPQQTFAGHFHDTYKMACANVFAALQTGVTIFDSAVGNLGGCQFAKGATGNVSTELLVYLLNGMGIETGVNLDKIKDIAQNARGLISKAE